MQPDNLVNLLTYGAIGLGLALAILAYLLLRTEQRVDRPRKQIITAIYGFMFFSFFLCSAGFMSEYFQSDVGEIPKLQEKINRMTDRLTTLSSSRQVIAALMNQKDGKIKRLENLDPADPSYVPLVKEIQRDLKSLDQSIRKALEE